MWLQGGVDDAERLDLDATRAVLRRTARRLRPYRADAWRAFGLLVLWTGTVVAGPVLVGWAVDVGIRPRDGRALTAIVVGYLIVASAGYVLYRWAVVSLARVGENFLRDLRVGVFDRLVRQSMAFHDRNRPGVLVSRMTSDIDSLGELVQFGLLMFTAAALQLIGTIIVLTMLSPMMMLVCLISVPVVAVASRKFQRDSNRAYLAVRDHIGDTLSALQEGISGVRIVQAFAREELEAERFARTNDELYRSHMASVKVAAWYLPVIDMAGTLTTAAAIALGGYLAADGDPSIGTVVAFILLLQRVFEPVQQLSQLFNLVQSATASLSKVFGLLDEEVDIDEPEAPRPLPATGDLELEGVRFAYGDGPDVVADVDLRIADGERIAFVGPTGAGKSTVAKLVARFYDPTGGVVRFGGVDLRDASPAEIRRRVLVVPQEGHLFAGSIGDNIAMASPGAGDDEVWAALRAIGAADRFAAFPDGLATELVDGGGRLSAGERQLVSLARAALADPAVLVLDEATSSLDPAAEHEVEDALEALMAGRTVVVIAHRLSTSERSDRVAVIADGGIAELGTHDDLVAAGGRYAAMFETWSRAGVS
ncbi:MAG: ABC transporter ATP-binding protein [Acidimicrobiales bacterium]